MQGLTRLILALCFLSVPAFGAEEEELPGYYVTEGDRLWTNFGRESAVVGSWKGRLEARAVAVNYGSEDNEPDFTGFPLDDLEEALAIAGTPDTVKAVEGTRMDFIGAYGLGPTIEIGFDVPLIVERISFDGSTDAIATTNVGDVVLHAKFRKMVSSSLAVGGGLEISTPTGPESDRLGTGELGLNPFVNTRYTSGGFAVGAHLGFQFFENEPANVFNYSFFLIGRRNEHLALRLEFNGRFFKDYGQDFNDISLQPGIDIDITDRISIRPQAMFGLNNAAMEWGAGMGAYVDLF